MSKVNAIRKKALEFVPKDGRAHRALGIAYTLAGKPRAAVEEYKAYLALMPDAEDAEQLKKMIDEFESSEE